MCGVGLASSTETICSGEENLDGTYMLTLDPSIHITNAVLVYTEPSNTLLLAVYDVDFLQTPEGIALESSLSPLAQVEGDLPSTGGRVLLPSGPAGTDTHVRVVGYGEIDGVTFSDETLTNTRTDLSDFMLGLIVGLEPGGGPIVVTTCCKCGDPPKDCGCVTDCASWFCDCVNCKMTCED
jgi:hypothetical protein